MWLPPLGGFHGRLTLDGLIASGDLHTVIPFDKVNPHPAIIEIFNLPERLKYKKGRVSEKKFGQQQLASLIKSLECNERLPLKIPSDFDQYLDEGYIDSLKGKALKSNEDTLDAIICLYIAGLYAVGATGRTFGDVDSGYIWIPDGESKL